MTYNTEAAAEALLGAKQAPSGLVKHRIDLIAFLHLKLIGCLLATEPTAVEKEGDGIEIHRLTVAVGVHQLLQLRGSLDSEEYLVAVLQNEGTSVENYMHRRTKIAINPTETTSILVL